MWCSALNVINIFCLLIQLRNIHHNRLSKISNRIWYWCLNINWTSRYLSRTNPISPPPPDHQGSSGHCEHWYAAQHFLSLWSKSSMIVIKIINCPIIIDIQANVNIILFKLSMLASCQLDRDISLSFHLSSMRLTIWQFVGKIAKMSLGRYAMHLLFILYAPDMLHLIISDWYCTLSANNLLKLLDSDMKLRLLVPYAPCVAVHIMHLIGVEPDHSLKPLDSCKPGLLVRKSEPGKKWLKSGEVTICQKSLDATSASEKQFFHGIKDSWSVRSKTFQVLK